MSVDHYENFPVASILLPANIRQDVVRLYRFARAADDIADEGDATPEQRRRELGRFRQALIQISENPTALTLGDIQLDSIFLPLSKTIHRHHLPLALLTDLLSAFEQDTRIHYYRNEAQLLDYCARSANPVGRLMLHLLKQTDAQSLAQSDAICTALQRINFLQDVAIDLTKHRIYIPREAMQEHGVTNEQLQQGRCDGPWSSLMAQQIDICRDLMKRGSPLGRRLSGRVGLEIRLIMAGGLRILEKIESVSYDVFRKRPTLNKLDWLSLIAKAL